MSDLTTRLKDQPGALTERGAQAATLREHHYRTAVRWLGDNGTGTSGYRAYRRDYSIEAQGKPPIPGSSDPHFRGDARVGIPKNYWSRRCRHAIN